MKEQCKELREAGWQTSLSTSAMLGGTPSCVSSPTARPLTINDMITEVVGVGEENS